MSNKKYVKLSPNANSFTDQSQPTDGGLTILVGQIKPFEATAKVIAAIRSQWLIEVVGKELMAYADAQKAQDLELSERATNTPDLIKALKKAEAEKLKADARIAELEKEANDAAKEAADKANEGKDGQAADKAAEKAAAKAAGKESKEGK